MIVTSLAVGLLAGAKISTLFSDGAVLQRGRPIPVFGTGDPGTIVEVALDDKKMETTVAAQHSGRITLLAAAGSMQTAGAVIARIVPADAGATGTKASEVPE